MLNKITEITPRFVLYTNYTCNQRCSFCYYLDKVGQKNILPLWQAKAILLTAYILGKRAVDFSGGEPTLHPALPEMILYAKNLGYTTICIITNGSQIAQENYLLGLKNAGLNELLISLHGSKAKDHDTLVQTKESFNKAIQAIKNSQKHSIPVRTNIVVNEHNYLQLGAYFTLLKKLHVKTVNLLVINPASYPIRNQSQKLKNGPMYEAFGKEISQILDRYEKNFKIVNVRFMPFCYLKKHKNNIRNVWQKIHESEEWDPFMSSLFRKNGLAKTLKDFFLGLNINTDVPCYRTSNFRQFISKTLNKTKVKMNYQKNELCLYTCALSPICDGIPKDYIQQFGFPKVFPIPKATNKTIYTPLFFVKQKTYE